MPSIGHLAVGLAAARVTRRPDGPSPWAWSFLLIVLSFLPDADVIAFRLGIPYGAPYGHRGAFHSPAFAAIFGLGLAVAATARRAPPLFLALVGTVVMASHGLLDTLTDGGKGIALLWPFTNERFFAPWRPIPVAPIGPRILSAAGLKLMAWEAMLFLPFFIVGLWPRRPEAAAQRSHAP
jgi:inner membrane protein